MKGSIKSTYYMCYVMNMNLKTPLISLCVLHTDDNQLKINQKVYVLRKHDSTKPIIQLTHLLNFAHSR